ncbi:MAG TPA: hypothetical protein VMS12_02515, partial [Thermoanaerobaculia bacterium]|nr:hypothetical protein [Thermoanaerobaculia bacterium]
MKLFRTVLMMMLLAFVPTACGAETPGEPETASESAELGHPTSEQTAAPQVDAAAQEERFFTREQLPERCELLTTEDVSAATGVPASAISQRAVSGCLYSWKAGSSWKEGSIMLTSVYPHKTLQRAQRHHAQHTTDATAAEVGEAKKQLQNELAKKRAAGELTPAEESVGSAIVGHMPERDFTHQSLDGVGSEAAIEGRTVYIRYGNVTITLGG